MVAWLELLVTLPPPPTFTGVTAPFPPIRDLAEDVQKIRTKQTQGTDRRLRQSTYTYPTLSMNEPLEAKSGTKTW